MTITMKEAAQELDGVDFYGDVDDHSVYDDMSDARLVAIYPESFEFAETSTLRVRGYLSHEDTGDRQGILYVGRGDLVPPGNDEYSYQEISEGVLHAVSGRAVKVYTEIVDDVIVVKTDDVPYENFDIMCYGEDDDGNEVKRALIQGIVISMDDVERFVENKPVVINPIVSVAPAPEKVDGPALEIAKAVRAWVNGTSAEEALLSLSEEAMMYAARAARGS